MIQFLNTYKPREDFEPLFKDGWDGIRQVQADRKHLEDLMREAGIAKPKERGYA